MFSRKYLLLSAAGILGAAIWIGYRAECRVMDSAGNKPLTVQSVVRRVTAPREQIARIDRLNRLRHTAGRSQPSPREKAEAWQIIREMRLEDVKASLAEIPPESVYPANRMLVEMLFSRWAQLDPEEAARTAMEPPYKEQFAPIRAVAAQWGSRDPIAALRWAGTHPTPGVATNLISESAGRSLAMQNAETAIQTVATEFPYALYAVVETLSRRGDVGDEVRRRHLAALRKNGSLVSTYLEGLINRSTVQDPEKREKMIALAESAGIGGELIQEFRMDIERRSQITDYTQMTEGLLGPGSSAALETQRDRYRQWVSIDSEKALAWVQKSGREDLIVEQVKSRAGEMLLSSWQPGDSSASFWETNVRGQYEAWSKHDAAAAEAWLQTMPLDMRQFLTSHDARR
ncbi:hypothetical protein OJ996_11135 [Luteolibacter sp. GHJ8]|uniref:Uncharacterized protein n=1 Tax=Luteolibacter rhizosphaerae TaxID=2989719 RepID=A0ABT3G2R5_9BACT|nr:hypothetical protein [Luteolibacter rhizosphaerae]MCW1914133.1 hypothetical protein [Luteolibacter rhizosphaerae]